MTADNEHDSKRASSLHMSDLPDSVSGAQSARTGKNTRRPSLTRSSPNGSCFTPDLPTDQQVAASLTSETKSSAPAAANRERHDAAASIPAAFTSRLPDTRPTLTPHKSLSSGSYDASRTPLAFAMTPPHGLSRRRGPSPVREEGGPRYTPAAQVTEASNSLPPPSGGTESTESSSRTIRGSTANTPAALPMRTPSYPFPYVPGTPKSWPHGLHQPFTVLSPTGRPSGHAAAAPSLSDIRSDASTPGPTATNATFLPPNTTPYPVADDRYPTPNLYDLALELNVEPGLDSWWAAVVRIMRDAFMAERLSLALPADSSDLENVPWGQKATYNIAGLDETSDARTVSTSSSGRPGPLQPPTQDFPRQPRPHIVRSRPSLSARHSYAGHIAVQQKESSAARPGLASRTVSHMPTQTTTPMATVLNSDTVPIMGPGTPDARHSSVSDTEDSSFLGTDGHVQPYTDVFPVLRGLNNEVDGLIDSVGVNKVLSRGRIVTLTRDYSLETSNPDPQKSGPLNQQEVTPITYPNPTLSTKPLLPHKAGHTFRSVFPSIEIVRSQRRESAYEEYEQVPASPWAQSPAPSPAIQADPDINPFFASTESVESTFDPAAPSPDYTELTAIEAIGVDRANTVIHLPLVHPTQSPLMPAVGDLDCDADAGSSSPIGAGSGERRAPIAIISLLSHAVPFPPNLVQNLSLLAPHLATSYSQAQQYTSTLAQAMGISNRRSTFGRVPGLASLTINASNLDEMSGRDRYDNGGSFSGSITSPSDCSGRSRHSPTSSLAGTPGWDAGSYNRSVSGTPAALRDDHGEGYFDTHRQRVTSGRVTTSATATPGKDPRRNRKSMLLNEDERATIYSTTKPERSPLRSLAPRSGSPPRATDSAAGSPRRPHFRTAQSHDPSAEMPDYTHTLLHSYGADFGASFQSLPASSQPTKNGPSHLRDTSISESHDMPPPSERLLRTIIDSLPVQIFTIAPDSGDITWVNSKYLVYRGQDQRKVMKEPWESIHPDERQEYKEQWHKSLRTGQQLQLKVRLQRFDGHYRWFYVRAAPLRDKRQKIVHWIGTNMDFHEQHLAEQTVSKQHETAVSEAKYRALANSSPQIVFTVNKVKGVLFCNSQWTSYSGQTETAALGLGFMEQVHPDDIIKCRLPSFEEGAPAGSNVPTTMPAEPCRSFSSSQMSSAASSETERAPNSPAHMPSSPMPQTRLSELASSGILKVSRDANGKPSYSTEVRLRSKDGEYRWHLVRVVVEDRELRVDDDDVELWYGTCTDINDHKALERDLKETMDEKSRFLSNMSHEIRTPLNGITGMVNFLIDSSLTVEQLEHVNIIRASTEGLRGLINDILDLSKAEAGMIQLSMAWLHVRSLLEEVNDLTSTMAIDKGLELNYLVEADVPSQIEGDRFRIRQILLNIIGNGIKFTQTGEVFVRCSVVRDLSVKVPPDEMYIQFDVIDTGRGFTEKEAQYLFKRFSQIDGSSTRQHGGTGLGLVISRQLAQLHGGDMTAKGVPGRGSTFTFYIKTSLPSKGHQPPAPDSGTTPNVESTKGHQTGRPLVPGGTVPRYEKGLGQAYGSPKAAPDFTQSPAELSSSGSAGMSSGSSDPSIRTAYSLSIGSGRSSASSFAIPEVQIYKQLSPKQAPMQLTMPAEVEDKKGHGGLSEAPVTVRTLSPGGSVSPQMYSILVVCPLEHSREATVHHMKMTVPDSIPHQISARGSVAECRELISGDNAIMFSHIVLVHLEVGGIIEVMQSVFASPCHGTTQLILISDMGERRKLIEQAPEYDFDKMGEERRVRIVFKPLKPSKFAVIFDPQKEREMSTDRNQHSAQQVALDQKQAYEEMKRRLGNSDRRVLLVEDNRINQMVLLKFLGKISVQVDVVQDGVQCTDKFYSKPAGYYSIVLCDLHMPNKDGYQTCREIREYEKRNSYPHVPIVALSANVLGDVWAKCVESGFNNYVTKPVDFKELGNVMLKFMDPSDPKRPIEFMKAKKKHAA